MRIAGLIFLCLIGCSVKGPRPSVVDQYQRYRTVEALKRYLDTAPEAEERAALSLALEIDPKDAGIQERLARFQNRSGDVARAEATLRQAISQEPSYAPAYLSLASLLISRGERIGAAELCRLGKSLSPIDPRFRHCLELLKIGESEEQVKRRILLQIAPAAGLLNRLPK